MMSRWTQGVRLGVLSLAFGIAVACGVGLSGLGEVDSVEPPGSVLFSEHQTEPASTATLQFGEKCAGGSGCLSGTCVHNKATQDGYVCSKACQADSDCPDGAWVCRSVFPAPDSSFCFPVASKPGPEKP